MFLEKKLKDMGLVGEDWKGWIWPWDYFKNKEKAGIFSCPSAQEEKSWGTDYGMNSFLGISACGGVSNGVQWQNQMRRYYRATNIKRPSSLMMLADSRSFVVNDETEVMEHDREDSIHWYQWSIRYRHYGQDGLNVLYFDGHIGSIRKDEMPESPTRPGGKNPRTPPYPPWL
jgi:prepilin-type processing-associated H-X9-DG protein